MPLAVNSLPPFPSGIRLAQLHKVSLKKLCDNNANESDTLFNACTSVGFFLLDLRDELCGRELLTDVQPIFALAEELFDLDIGEKNLHTYTPTKSLIGYKPLGSSKLNSAGLRDRNEFWGISRDDMLSLIDSIPNPKCVGESRSSIKRFILSSHKVLQIILQHLDHKLQLPSGTLASKQDLEGLSASHVRLFKTPRQPVEDRCASLVAHTDIGAVTLLFNILGGNAELDSDWHWVKPEDGFVIVNMGDAMVKWSNGIIRSNMHRVTFPPGAQADFVRYSVVYFSRPAYDCIMAPLAESPLIQKYAGTTTTDFIDKDDGIKNNNVTARFLTAWEWERRKGYTLDQGLNEPKSLGGVVDISKPYPVS